MRDICIVMLVCISVMGYAVNASAQFVPTIKEMTAFGGLTFSGKDETTAGVALAMNISPRVGVEGEIGTIFYDDTKFNVNANLVLNLGNGTTPLVPYLTGGAGFLINGNDEIALNAGFGLKMFVEMNMALRVDARGFFTTEGGEVQDMERLYAGFTVFF